MIIFNLVMFIYRDPPHQPTFSSPLLIVYNNNNNNKRKKKTSVRNALCILSPSFCIRLSRDISQHALQKTNRGAALAVLNALFCLFALFFWTCGFGFPGSWGLNLWRSSTPLKLSGFYLGLYLCNGWKPASYTDLEAEAVFPRIRDTKTAFFNDRKHWWAWTKYARATVWQQAGSFQCSPVKKILK